VLALVTAIGGDSFTNEMFVYSTYFLYGIKYNYGMRTYLFDIFQWYIGPEAKMEFITEDYVQKTTVNGGEAFFVITDFDLPQYEKPLTKFVPKKSLYWYLDGIVTSIHSYDDGINKEDMIAIAESMR